ncbi:MAG TPA: flagellar export protein FliJ [Bacillota bacterium]|nr:flagellar export protein FliJ [Bacillota bacterium]
MKKFKFSLQKVLDVARAKEDMALEEFAKAQNLVLQQKNFSHNLEVKYQSVRFGSEEEEILSLVNRESYLQALMVRIERAYQKLAELEDDLKTKRMILIDAMRNRKLLEKLREKAQERYKKAVEHEEQLFLDEIGILAFSRKEGEYR